MGEFTSQSVDLLDESYLLLGGPCGDDEGPGFLLVLDCDCIPIQTVFTDWGSIMTHASLILNLPTLKRGYSWLRLYLYIPTHLHTRRRTVSTCHLHRSHFEGLGHVMVGYDND